MGYVGGRPDGTLSQEKYYTEAEVRERERAAFVEGAKWQSYGMTDEVKAAEVAMRRYGGEA